MIPFPSPITTLSPVRPPHLFTSQTQTICDNKLSYAGSTGSMLAVVVVPVAV